MSDEPSPYEVRQDLGPLQELAMDEARSVLENAGLKVERMAIIFEFTSPGQPTMNMAAFFPMDDWAAHVELMRETTKVCEASSNMVEEAKNQNGL